MYLLERRAPLPRARARLDSPVFVLDDPDYYCFRGSGAEGEPPSPGAAPSLRSLSGPIWELDDALATVNGSSASRGKGLPVRGAPAPVSSDALRTTLGVRKQRSGPSCSGWPATASSAASGGRAGASPVLFRVPPLWCR